MGRKTTGSLYWSKGAPFISISLDKRRSFKLSACLTQPEAELRRTVIVGAATRLKDAGHIDVAVRFCEQAAGVDEATLGRLLTLVEGVLHGDEHVAPHKPPVDAPGSAMMTVREFGENLWTNNALARRYRGRVRAIDHKEKILRLNKHVYPVVFGVGPWATHRFVSSPWIITPSTSSPNPPCQNDRSAMLPSACAGC